MMRSASATPIGSEFDEFLFAPIGEERNGMLLRVVSALARLDLDPWREAAELAGLAVAPATQRLASLLAALPDRPSAAPDSGTIAARLIALLPRRVNPNVTAHKTPPGASAATNSWLVLYVILMLVALGAQWIATSRQPPPTIDRANTAVVGKAIPPSLSP